ncbi:RNA polymerase sigma factor [Planctomyces sp. SH-PL62]|uniref:RNA polymerase sigma factor n=1 Tax=Planctomyces sp. SH-PL62 TaxID=1636152 RepID=UPI000838D6F8|nr:RNA polymerase sigma factor [Planctomyces sp. SH-PL62]
MHPYSESWTSRIGRDVPESDRPARPHDEAAEPAAIPVAPTDEEIVRRVLEGDTASFELIMRRYNQRLFRVVRSIIGGESETEDVMQETYLRAYEHLGRFEGRSQFSTWLTRIAVHEATARLRKRRLRRIASDRSGAAPPAVDRDAVEEASQRELGRVLAAALDALPAELRVVFTLRVVERLSTEQTAECLNLTPANVKVRLHRARSALQHWIDRKIGEEARRLYAFAGEDCDRVVRRVLERIGPRPPEAGTVEFLR